MNNLKLYDLTIPQKSIYLTEEYATGSSVNLIGGNIIIDEPVNLDFLEKALNIFVKKNDPTIPYQYSMIQNQIMKMIRQEDIRDDNGELLQFGTHIFRHCYGKKLTEMHVDDWMIARLLGHTSTQSVHYYRKIGNKLMADETRAAREKIDMILLDIIEGWDDYEI